VNLSSRKKIFHHNEGNSSSWAKTDLSSVGGLSQMLQELGVDKSQWSDIAKRMANNMPGDDNPNAWSDGLSQKDQYEWLLNYYQMRCDDDYTWGGCNLHGPYNPDATP